MAKSKYGLNANEFKELATRQNNVCAICGEAETKVRQGRVSQLSIDHCHTTQVVRGLLCGNCNAGLGMFEDNPVRLQAAIEYLKRQEITK